MAHPLFNRFQNDGQATLKLNSLQEQMRNEVQRKVESGLYATESTPCPVCNERDGTLLSKKDRYGLAYKVVACTRCGLVRTEPRMNQAAYNEFYNTEYRKLYVGTEVATEDFYYTQTRKGKSLLALISNQQGWTGSLKGKFVLEVGCGAGGILSVFAEKGATVLGLDLGQEYIEWGRKNKRLNLVSGFLKDVPIERKPDLIIYSHVLEHVLDVNEELQRIHALCQPETLVYIEVPGIKHIHANYRHNLLRYLQNAHTYHFSLTSLSNLMLKNGFKLISGTEYVRSIWKRGKPGASLQNDHDKCLAYLMYTEKERGALSNQFKNFLFNYKQRLVQVFKKP